MIVSLLWRIILELVSMKRFATIKPDGSLMECSQLMAVFYRWRKKVHLIQTPIIYLSYMIGFVMLLPALKANLSVGMFWYSAISGAVFLIGFGIFLVFFVQKEIKMLDYLKGIAEAKG